jgi:hypothetical protein
VIVRPLDNVSAALGWHGVEDDNYPPGAVEYIAFGIHAQVWPGQRDDVAYVPALVSEHPGSGRLDAFLTELKTAVSPREVVFVNVVNDRLAARLERAGYRLLTPEDAFQDDGSEGAIAHTRCPAHPKYDARKEPTVACARCWQLYFGISDSCINCGCQQNECEG